MTAPTPIEKRRLTGNPSKRPIPETTVIEGAVERIPDPPETLGAEGKKAWLRVWSVADKWLVPTLDLSLLVRYCEAHDERSYYRALIKKQGRMSEGSMRQPKLHPAVEELDRIGSAMLRMEDALGFSPVSRARLHIEKRKGKQDPFEDFLRRKRTG
jgi:P27 family predicted phage terminase small subunit